MRRTAVIMALAMLLAAAAGPAAAQSPLRVQGPLRVQARGVIAACAADYRALCPGVAPGGGRIVACLNAQAEKLSQRCFQALAAEGLAFAAALRLCRADVERLCAGTPLGGGRAISCLLGSRDRLSAGCRDALSAHGFEGEAD
ncbi:hypothetical protein PQJ75_19860 [Rhodoplanes sp. TEM]|uniref:Cysteine rich repeat protein n=1 Tax=Rhodoplanes tepidamans TaxID=200616 RepID=A0ABT5JAU9_RHOTP|nr:MULTISPECIES: hypothetical protein [Rhodoplanes]MDC7786810.1 hypothetical protein [Rhodoplanes tepidamans]MDC7985990.1 hypothetical protein [Rhodoplanes sp. TEM]MDQ0355937.1 hypothetical protein [Rhodoplanes tepidamans]